MPFGSLFVAFLTSEKLQQNVTILKHLKHTQKKEFNFTKMSKGLVLCLRCDNSRVFLRHSEQACCSAKTPQRPIVAIHQSQAASN